MNKEDHIVKLEDNLLKAMKLGNIEDLDRLIHDDLVFNIPTGQTISKEMDLENYRSGIFKIKELIPSDRTIKILDDLAIVAVTIHLNAIFMQNEIHGNFRYLRIWKNTDSNWQVIAGSSYRI